MTIIQDTSRIHARSTAERLAAEKYPMSNPRVDLYPRTRAGFISGYLAGRTVTDEQVETAAESMREQSPDGAPDWSDWVWHRYARAAFRAAGLRIGGEQ